MKFDFDYWASLAQTDPAEFEKQKKEHMLKELESYTGNDIKGMKTLVESLCAPTVGTPEEKMISAQNMMMEGYAALLAKLNELTAELALSGKTEISSVELYTRTVLTKK